MSRNAQTPAFGGKHPLAACRTLRAIAAFEALKGVAAVVVVIGVVDLLHHDVRHLVVALIGQFHLSPDGHYASLLLHYAALLPGANLRALILLALGYTALLDRSLGSVVRQGLGGMAGGAVRRNLRSL